MSELHAALRSYRSSKAAALSQPAFCVFSNAELDALVAACPHSTIELAAVKGFGRAKVQKFGDDIVRICSGHLKSAAAALPAAAAPAKRKAPAAPGGEGELKKGPGRPPKARLVDIEQDDPQHGPQRLTVQQTNALRNDLTKALTQKAASENEVKALKVL